MALFKLSLSLRAFCWTALATAGGRFLTVIAFMDSSD